MSPRARWLLPLDTTVFAVNGFFAVCSLVFVGRVHVTLFGLAVDRQLLVGLSFVIVTAILFWLLPRMHRSDRRAIWFVRIFYPQLLYTLYFTECIRLSQFVYGGTSFDAVFAQIEHFVFGMQPALHFAASLGQPAALNELFFFGYFFYYVLITSGFWILFLRGNTQRAARAVFLVTTAFAVLYVWYVFFPVHGPKYFIDVLHARYYAEFEGFIFTPLMKQILQNTNLAGAAFPSSHVAIAIVALLINRRYSRDIAWLFAPFTLLLMLSTVYIYAHYAVDVIAGVVVGFLLFVMVRQLYPLFVHFTGSVGVDISRRASRLW
jgi:membrane-associated phospholipid phosphatase